MGTFIVLAVVLIAYGVLIGGAVMYSLAVGLRALKLPVPVQRVTSVLLGTVILSPALAPAGTITVLPVPLSVLLGFTRSASDLTFLVYQWWFLAPSMLITAAVCSYVAWRMFPNHPSKRTRVPRAA